MFVHEHVAVLTKWKSQSEGGILIDSPMDSLIDIVVLVFFPSRSVDVVA